MKYLRIVSLVVIAAVVALNPFLTLGALAQTPPPSSDDVRGEELTPYEELAVQNALNVLKLKRPEVVGSKDKPGSLQGKLESKKVRTKPRKDQDKNPYNDMNGSDGRAYSNNTSGSWAGDIYLADDLFYDKFPNYAPDLKEVKDLCVLTPDEFRALVNLAEILLHEYVHTQQTEAQINASFVEYILCGPNVCEMEAYWEGILFKLDLKHQLLPVVDKSSKDTLAKLDLLDSLILESLARIQSPRPVPALSLPGIQWKTYEGIEQAGTANKTLGKIQTGPETEPEDIGKVEQRQKAVKDQRDKATQDRKKLSLDQNRKESKQGLIDPGTGGSIELPSGWAWVVVPPGSLQAPSEIEIHRMDLPGLSKWTNALSPVYELGLGQISLDPTKPARLYIRIANLALIKDAHLCMWDTYLFGLGYDGWQEILDGREVDELHGVISVEVGHSGYYMVIGSGQPPVVGIAVIDASNDQPLKGLAITIEQDGQEVYRVAESEETTLAPLPPGTYTVRVSQKILGFSIELASRTFDMKEPFILTVVVSAWFLPVPLIPTLANGLASILAGLVLGSVSRIIAKRFTKSRISALIVGLAVGVAAASCLFWVLLPSIS